MSLMGLAGFAEGLGNAKQKKNDQARYDQWLQMQEAGMNSLGAAPQGMGGPDLMRNPTGGIQPNMGGLGYGRPATGGAGVPGNGDFASLLAAKEGGGRYDTLFGHSQNGGRFAGVDVSKMTLDQASDFASPSGEYGQWVKSKVGRVATPMGFGQIVGTTLRATAKEMGLPGDTLFDERTQTAMVNHLAAKRIRGAKSQAAKRAGLRAEWEGFKNVSDADLDRAIAKFEAGGGLPSPAQAAPATAQPIQQPPAAITALGAPRPPYRSAAQ